MSKHCPSCGGILGVDCFNPDECAYITLKMDAEIERIRYDKIGKLIYECRELSKELDYYKRLAEAAEAVIACVPYGGNNGVFTRNIYLPEIENAINNYKSIKNEREGRE